MEFRLTKTTFWEISPFSKFRLDFAERVTKLHLVYLTRKIRLWDRKILFLLGRAFADIVWSCDQAAELCLSDRTFIPEEEICENQTCLNEKTDLCNDHEVFKNGDYGQFFCEEGPRSPNQVNWYISVRPRSKLKPNEGKTII